MLSTDKKMAGRPKIYDEDEVLDKAIGVFWEKGYENASADDLLKAMGIGKGSFYLAFRGGKQELFEKTMKRVVSMHFSEFRQMLESCADPVQLIKDFFLSLVGVHSPVGERGCYFGNALVQISEQHEGLRQMAGNYLDMLASIFKDAMRRGKESGSLQTDRSAEELSLYLVNVWNGVHITKRMGVDKAQLEMVMRMSLEVIC